MVISLSIWKASYKQFLRFFEQLLLLFHLVFCIVSKWTQNAVEGTSRTTVSPIRKCSLQEQNKERKLERKPTNAGSSGKQLLKHKKRYSEWHI